MRLTEAAKRMKKPLLIVVMLTMVTVAVVPALAQDGEFDVTPAEEPVSTCEWGPTEFSSPENPYAPNAGDPSDHWPGEFGVTYESVPSSPGATRAERVEDSSARKDTGWHVG